MSFWKTTTTRPAASFATVLLAVVAATPVAQAQGLLLEGGTVHSMAGEPRAASVWIDSGSIVAVGPDLDVDGEITRLDISGLHVYPGFFDAMSRLGLVEVSAVAATVDTTELGAFNPHLEAATALHPASAVIPVTRETGITHALVAPASGRGGVIPGRASLVHLDGWTVEEMAIDASSAMIVNWPAIQTRSFDFTTFTIRETPFSEAEKQAKEAQDELRDWFDAARHYAQAKAAGSDRLEPNLELEHLAAVLDRDLPVIFLADAARDIEAAIEFGEEQNLRYAIAGGRDAWKITDVLIEHSVPIILGRPQSLPQNDDDPHDRPFRTASVLADAGVLIAFGSSAGGGFGPGGPHSARTLPFEAATAVAHGLSADAALAALTLNPARILGVDDRLGTVEAGKVANLIVVDGDPLEITTHVRHLIIDGREVSTDNFHRQLYERYRSR
ncbi:MAG: amidohydrolase family protein [Acidobacteriota bacterium]